MNAAEPAVDAAAAHPVVPPLEDLALDLQAGESADERLEQVCRQRFAEGRQSGKWKSPAYQERLNIELAILRRLEALPRSAWAGAVLDTAQRCPQPILYIDETFQLRGDEGPIPHIAVAGLGLGLDVGVRFLANAIIVAVAAWLYPNLVR